MVMSLKDGTDFILAQGDSTFDIMLKASLGVDTTLKGRMCSSDVSAAALRTVSTRLLEELDVAEQGEQSALCGSVWPVETSVLPCDP